jgi:hypothetical protein
MKRLGILISLFLLVLCSSGCARRVVVYEQPAPPPSRVEIRTAAPCRGAVWVPGHWNWRGRGRGHVWAPGHWKRP